MPRGGRGTGGGGGNDHHRGGSGRGGGGRGRRSGGRGSSNSNNSRRRNDEGGGGGGAGGGGSAGPRLSDEVSPFSSRRHDKAAVSHCGLNINWFLRGGALFLSSRTCIYIFFGADRLAPCIFLFDINKILITLLPMLAAHDGYHRCATASLIRLIRGMICLVLCWGDARIVNCRR